MILPYFEKVFVFLSIRFFERFFKRNVLYLSVSRQVCAYMAQKEELFVISFVFYHFISYNEVGDSNFLLQIITCYRIWVGVSLFAIWTLLKT